MLTWLVDQVNYLWGRISSVASDALRWAREKADAALAAAKAFAQGLFDSIKSSLSAVLNNALYWVHYYYDRAVGAAQGLVDGVLALAVALFNQAVAGAQSLVNGVVSLAYALFDRAVQTAQSLVNGVSALAGALFDRATAAAQALVNGLQAVAVALFDRALYEVNQQAARIGAATEQGARWLYSLATDPIGTIGAVLLDLFLDILEWVLAHGLASPGTDIGPPPSFGTASGGPWIVGTAPPPGASGLVPPLSSLYVSGYRFNPPGHPGVDFGLTSGQPVFAMHDGIVVTAIIQETGYGHHLAILGDPWWSLYGHLDGLLVGRGDKVRAGQQIAGGDTTGNSTGNHLHLEIKYQGKYIDPLSVL